MKRLIILMFMALPFASYAQAEEPQYFIYNIVSFEGDFTKEDFKVYYDDGVEVKRYRNDQGKTMEFKTPAAALMYFFSIGWELFQSGTTYKEAAMGSPKSSKSSSYWILRKPCTKAEFEEAVKKGHKN